MKKIIFIATATILLILSAFYFFSTKNQPTETLQNRGSGISEEAILGGSGVVDIN